ncbi:MAG: trigger factor [Candidatus Omnitrophica bacterium]|nr:trigger factor [Candidatus Omnitrophota bacterium]
MKTSVKIKNCECDFDVKIPHKKVAETYDQVYKEIAKEAKVPGFRPGKAPMDIIQKNYAQSAKDEVVKQLVPAGYRQVIEEHKIEPISMPDITDLSFNEKQDLEFKGMVELKPDFKVKKYFQIQVKSAKVNVEDGEVKDMLDRYQNIHAKFEPVKDKQIIDKDDYVICDIEVFVDDRPISKKHENMWVEANKETSLLGLGENLIGAKLNEEKQINAKLPENYPQKKFAGKESLFKILPKEIKQKQLPELNDEFAKDMGVETFEKFKSNLKEQIFQRKTQDTNIKMKNQIMDKLLSDNKFSVPASMVKRQFEVLVKHFEEDLLSKGINKEDVEDKKAGVIKQLEEEAEKKIRLYFILEQISHLEKVAVSQEEIDQRIAHIAAMSRQDINTVKNYYEKNGMVEGLTEQIREDKTLDILLEKADIVTK